MNNKLTKILKKRESTGYFKKVRAKARQVKNIFIRCYNSYSKFLKRKESAEYYWEVRTKAQQSKNIFSRRYNRYLHRKLMIKYNASIPYTVEFEGKPVFPHGINGIFISLKASIGKNCTIFHQVTIGSNTLNSSKNCGSPKIGDNVYIGCGAKIIGGVTIGNNVRIGANCVVVQDVPDNSTVVMEKPRIIIHDSQRDNTFVSITNYVKQQNLD